MESRGTAEIAESLFRRVVVPVANREFQAVPAFVLPTVQDSGGVNNSVAGSIQQIFSVDKIFFPYIFAYRNKMPIFIN